LMLLITKIHLIQTSLKVTVTAQVIPADFKNN
jgi:hypothetical protein